jgi:acetyl-CoA acyltransferase
LTTDEGLRRATTADTLAALKPSFRPDGVIHAGNASQISDGAAAMLVTTPERAAALGLKPMVRYHTGAVAGADPVMVLTGPIPATAKVLERANLTVDDIGVFEVNEAFAPVPLAWLAETKAAPNASTPLAAPSPSDTRWVPPVPPIRREPRNSALTSPALRRCQPSARMQASEAAPR